MLPFGSTLDKLVTVQSFAYSGSGQRTVAFSAAGTMRARIEPLGSRRSNTVLGQFPSATHRAFSEVPTFAVKQGYQIVSGSTTYTITGLMNQDGEFLELALEEMKV